ncbi:MAG: HlyD family type I secretion periplasmic adaptor subunit [Gammaproteobacteria bacterium]
MKLEKKKDGKSKSFAEEIPGIQGITKKGLLVLGIFIAVFLIWGLLFPLESASVSPGKVTVDSYRKTVQHLEGGIVKKIFVRDGDKVEMGQPLIQLADVQSKSESTRLEEKLMKLQVREVRLTGERNHRATLDFPDDLLKKIKTLSSTEMDNYVETQKALFESRKDTYASTIQIYKQKISQSENEIKSLQSKVTSFDTQLAYIQQEIVAMKKLLEKNYVSRVRYWALLRSEADLKGKRDENLALIHRTEQKLAETQTQLVNFKNEWNSDILKELSDAHVEITDLSKQLDYASDVDERTIIRAPIAGTIEGSKVHTIGGVIKPMESIMDIVPKEDMLIIEAQIDPLDIDVVHVGLQAKVYLSAYNIRHLPTLEGEVTYVSSDAFEDPKNGGTYYVARIVINRDQMSKLENVKLYPGMPAEIMIITDKNTFLGYLFKPVGRSFNKAFREQ